MKASELLKILKKNGIRLERRGGNHDICYSPITNQKFTVPRHTGKEIATGTVENIMKMAGLKK